MSKQLFVLTSHCTSRVHCHTCRNLEKGRAWRTSLAGTFELPDNKIDFDCPYGVPWEAPPQTEVKQTVATSVPQPRPSQRKETSSRGAGGCGGCGRNK